jgi:hypothetical protein
MSSKKEVKEQSQWNPVRKGAIYCSPACGFGCTWAQHEEAKERAELLAKRLGPGWKPEVHENMGWHFKASKGKATMHPVGFIRAKAASTYWLSIDGDVKQFIERGRDPVEMVRRAVSAMRNAAATLLSEAAEVAP